VKLLSVWLTAVNCKGCFS